MFSTVTRFAIRRANDFFFGLDKTPWDFIRIGSAVIVLATLALMGLSGNYARLYGHYGMLPRSLAVDGVYWPGFFFLMKMDPGWIWQIYWTTVAAAFCLAIGLWTRIAAAITFFLYVAMVQRNPVSYNGETGILALTLVTLVFAPAPHPFSFDHLLLKQILPAKPEAWPARFLQINLCMMYFFTTVVKLRGQWDFGVGEVWYQITLSDWFRFPNADWLRVRPICWLAIHGSLLLEGSFAFVVWTRLRLPVVLFLMGMHTLIIILFDNALAFFNLAAIVALCGFLKTDDFARIARRWSAIRATARRSLQSTAL
jgi:hypothetical protein